MMTVVEEVESTLSVGKNVLPGTLEVIAPVDLFKTSSLFRISEWNNLLTFILNSNGI